MASPRFDRLPHAAAGLLLAAALPAAAQDWGGALGFGSDNVYRGVSQTSGRPSWLADVHYRFDENWTAGLGASAERPQYQSSGAQFTLYLDRLWQLDEDWSAKLGVMHYESPWNVWRDELNYNELNAAIGWRGRWRLSLALSPDTPGIFSASGAKVGFVASAELSYQQPVAGRLAANFGLGYANLKQVADLVYGYGSAGLSYGAGDVYIYSSVLWSTPGALRYNTGAQDRTRWVTTLVWSF
ncbi:hypothetical protein [Tahibacter harae]|uniref:Cellulose biosynthesis protein BcsS n=1 Tax=Tahibacter harae TaxID=2963937 RepID=A0ABT1QU70_9GAMM|nr:hypothetical protein [Tahibacter harae]MCQ4165824.1 hypothetical protein [Tahibacter harae]